MLLLKRIVNRIIKEGRVIKNEMFEEKERNKNSPIKETTMIAGIINTLLSMPSLKGPFLNFTIFLFF